MTGGGTDVIVVGAGPAGSATAYHLARAGLRVTLMDRAPFPRPKVCGDGLTPRAVAELGALGILPKLATGHTIDALITVDLTDGHETHGPVPSLVGSSASMVVPRVELDDALRRAAEEAGARFSPHTVVRELIRSGGTVIGVEASGADGMVDHGAKATVVAGGSTSGLRRTLRPAHHHGAVGVAVRQYFHLRAPLEPAFRIYVPLVGDASALCGYGWVFPVRENLANVGVGCFVSRDAARPRLRGVFREFLGALNRVEPRIDIAASCGRLEGGVIDASLRLGDYPVDGVLFVGDAAGAANPFTGEGIAQALVTGRLAADAIVDHLSRGRPLGAAYVERLAAHFPHRDAWMAWLPWLAERGGFRTREFLEMVSGRAGTLARSVRSVVLERGTDDAHRAAARASAVDRRGDRAWVAVQRSLERRHPLLARLVAETRPDLGAHVDAAIDAYRVASKGHGEEIELPLALLALMGLAAEDATDHGAAGGANWLSARTSWAVNAMSLGAADLLVSACFAALSTAAPSDAAAFASAARQLFGNALGDELAASGRKRLGESLQTTAARLGRAVAGTAQGRRAQPAAIQDHPDVRRLHPD